LLLFAWISFWKESWVLLIYLSLTEDNFSILPLVLLLWPWEDLFHKPSRHTQSCKNLEMILCTPLEESGSRVDTFCSPIHRHLGYFLFPCSLLNLHKCNSM
jgi:hypothetical protein